MDLDFSSKKKKPGKLFTLQPFSCPIHRTLVSTEVSSPQATCTHAVLDTSISAAPIRRTVPMAGGEEQQMFQSVPR